MTNIAVAIVAVCAAFVAATIISRRRVDAPTQIAHHVPAQLDRADFDADAPWLVVVFTSATCHTCDDVHSKASVLACADVAVVNAEYGENKSLHERYRIDAVPTLVVADADGVVRSAFLGPVKAQDLWAAVAECRSPGSTPEPDLGRDGLSKN